MSPSRPSTHRLEAIASLIPEHAGIVVDVGADHGHLAHAVGAVAVERAPRRLGRRDVPWVVCDGLEAFSNVDVAILAGMGADSILRILARGPRPTLAAILHTPQEPGRLRQGLARAGWSIDAELAAPEGPRFAEIVRVRPGVERANGLDLWFGPWLTASPHAPWYPSWKQARITQTQHTLRALGPHEPEKSELIRQRLAYLQALA